MAPRFPLLGSEMSCPRQQFDHITNDDLSPSPIIRTSDCVLTASTSSLAACLLHFQLLTYRNLDFTVAKAGGCLPLDIGYLS